MKVKKYLVAYLVTDGDDCRCSDKDIYEPFIDGTSEENEAEARARYHEVKEMDKVYTANFCEIIESTDYFD